MNSLASIQAPQTMQRSRGSGRLSVRLSEGVNRLDTLYQEGCAKLRLPKNHDNALEAVMINTSGGMTGGDRMNWQFHAQPESTLSLTTQACERIYRSSGGTATTEVQIAVGQGARICWLPQETILFDKCRFSRTLDVNMEAGSTGLFLEAFLFGRETMGETITQAEIHDRWRVRLSGRLIHAEDFRMSGNIDAQLQNAAIGNGALAMATLLLVSPLAESMLGQARKLIGNNGGVTFVPLGDGTGKLLARLTAKDGYNLRKALIPLVHLLNEQAGLPKVWST